MGWQVVVSCPACRSSTVVWPPKAPAALQAVPIHDLFQRGAFRCRKPACKSPADRVTVECMDVGMLKQVAEWKR